MGGIEGSLGTTGSDEGRGMTHRGFANKEGGVGGEMARRGVVADVAYL